MFFIGGTQKHGKGVRTRFSDDLLWLVYVVCEYINYTGDYAILDKVVPYVYGEELPEGVDERYDEYKASDIKENIYMHCKRAIDRSINFGERGLPKIRFG